MVTHEELRPLKVIASRLPCPYLNPGRFVRGRPLVQGMRVALSAEVKRTHEELVERILHAGLAYTDAVDPETSLVICNEPEPEQGKGYQAHELGVPLVSDAEFMELPGRRDRRHRHRGVHRPHPRRRPVRAVLNGIHSRRGVPNDGPGVNVTGSLPTPVIVWTPSSSTS